MPKLHPAEIRASLGIQQRTCVYCWHTHDTAGLATLCEQSHEQQETASWLANQVRAYKRDVLGEGVDWDKVYGAIE